MGKLWDFLSGGNIKVSANALADLYFSTGGNYTVTFNAKCIDLTNQMHQAQNPETIAKVVHNEIMNLSELAVAELNAFAAPKGTPFHHTSEDFIQKIASHLRERNIPEQHISGDNTNLTAVQEISDNSPNENKTPNEEKIKKLSISDNFDKSLIEAAANNHLIGFYGRRYEELKINPIRAEAQFLNLYQNEYDWLTNLGGWIEDTQFYNAVHGKNATEKIFASRKSVLNKTSLDGVGSLLAFYVGATTEGVFIQNGIWDIISGKEPDSEDTIAFLELVKVHDQSDLWTQVKKRLLDEWVRWDGL